MSSESEIRLKEGELRKYRNVWYGWKKYYFKLERSYLHYFETKYTAKPVGTTTRGEIDHLQFSKDQPVIGFEVHLKTGEIWYLQAASNEERMDWMRALKPDAIIVDPFMNNNTSASHEASQPLPSAPLPQEENSFPANYQRIYPNLPRNTPTAHGAVCSSDSLAPPAYDDMNYRYLTR